MSLPIGDGFGKDVAKSSALLLGLVKVGQKTGIRGCCTDSVHACPWEGTLAHLTVPLGGRKMQQGWGGSPPLRKHK